MSAVERELLEQIRKLDDNQQRRVLDFVRSLAHHSSDWEQQPWTEEEIRELMTPHPKTGAEIAAWIDENLPDNLNWDGITNDGEVAEHVREMRRQKRHDWGQDE